MARFTLTLGEARLAHFDLGNKVALLDKLALRDLSNKGLMPARFAPIQTPVPESAVILDEFYRHALSAGLARVEKNKVVIDDPAALLDAIELPPITGSVAVRSAFTAEDGSDGSMAGRFESVLSVPIEWVGAHPSRVRDPKPLADAIARVWSSGLARGAAGRMDVLVMRMVDAKHAGVAFTEGDYEDDLVNYTEGIAADMVAGKAEARALELPKLQPLEMPDRAPTNIAFARRLQVLLRSIRMALGHGDWDVEWADDGEKIWIIQVRPITVPTVRSEVFAYSPIKEALPDLPSRFMATLIESCGDEIFSYYRELDPKLPARRRYIEVFFGRPMLNVSLMMDMMRHWGLPTSAVTAALGSVPANAHGPDRRRLLRSRSVRLALRMSAMGAVRRSRSVAADLKELGTRPAATITEAIESARHAYIKVTRHNMILRQAMRGLGGSAGMRSAGTRIFSDLEPLRERARANPGILPSLRNGEVPRDAVFRHRWEAWLRQHGHRAFYESDLGRPRFRESQGEVLQLIAAPTVKVSAARKPVFAFLASRSSSARALRAREELRFDAMVAFERIRARLLELARPLGLSADDFFSLSIEEARRLDSGWRPTAVFLRARRKEIREFAAMRIPDTMRRNDPIDPAGGSRSLHGIGLSRGEAIGKALVVREPFFRLPEGYAPYETILVASSVDAGWVPSFGLVAGVVVEAGGNLSHGSIILRELGIPAATNVRGATHQIQSGQRVRVAASQGRVDILG